MAETDLPPSPVDDATLDLLGAAIDPWAHGNPDAGRSSVGDLLKLMSQLGGSDTEAVAELLGEDGENVRVMRDPQYTERDVIIALIAEIRRIRVATDG